jgi:DHA1 family tetracycline resistance protein-like MFS transporter
MSGTTSRFALTFIFFTMLIDTIGLGIIIPVSPGLIAQLTHQNLSGAARWGGWLFFSYALMQFLCAPLIGNLSDRFGRRPVLILSLAMLGVDYLITGLSPTIAWLFIGRTLSGMAGASYPTANASISPTSRRPRNAPPISAWWAQPSVWVLCWVRRWADLSVSISACARRFSSPPGYPSPMLCSAWWC